MKSRKRAPRVLPSRGSHDLHDLSQLPCAPRRFVRALQPLKSPGPTASCAAASGAPTRGSAALPGSSPEHTASPLLTESLLEPKLNAGHLAGPHLEAGTQATQCPLPHARPLARPRRGAHGECSVGLAVLQNPSTAPALCSGSVASVGCRSHLTPDEAVSRLTVH